MKKLVSILLLLLPAIAIAQKPDVVRTPNGPNTIIDWNVKFKTMIAPHGTVLTLAGAQDTTGHLRVIYNPGVDTSLYMYIHPVSGSPFWMNVSKSNVNSSLYVRKADSTVYPGYVTRTAFKDSVAGWNVVFSNQFKGPGNIAHPVVINTDTLATSRVYHLGFDPSTTNTRLDTAQYLPLFINANTTVKTFSHTLTVDSNLRVMNTAGTATVSITPHVVSVNTTAHSLGFSDRSIAVTHNGDTTSHIEFLDTATYFKNNKLWGDTIRVRQVGTNVYDVINLAYFNSHAAGGTIFTGGLTKTADTVRLGGNVTGNVTININNTDPFAIQIGNGYGNMTTFGDGSGNLFGTQITGSDGLLGQHNTSVSASSTNMFMQAINTTSTPFTRYFNMDVTDTASHWMVHDDLKKGIEVDFTDYSKLTNNSYIPKGYADGKYALASSTLTPAGGLSSSGSNIILGGSAISGTSTIEIPATMQMQFSLDPNSTFALLDNFNGFSNFNWNISSGGKGSLDAEIYNTTYAHVAMNSSGGSDADLQLIASANSGSLSPSSYVGLHLSGTGIVFTDSKNTHGPENAADYSTYEIANDNALMSRKAVRTYGNTLWAPVGAAFTLTTTGSSGASTYSGGTLNIPQYQAQISGTGFVKASGSTISYDNSVYLTTSSASSTYVPYSGATGNVTLGSNNLSAQVLLSTGTAGAGYLDLVSQSASPASLSNHLRVYSDSVNRFSWKNTLYRRTIQVPYPSDYTIRMPYLVTGTTLEDSTHSAATYVPLTRTIAGFPLSSNVTLGTLTFGTHLSSGGSSYNGSAGVTITSDATNANTASTIVARDGSGNFSAGIITAALTGNASTATTLQTARNINGVSFDGSGNITVTANTTNTLTLGTGITGGSFTGASNVTAAVDQAFTPTWTGIHNFQDNGIATTPTDEIIVQNTTAAAAGAQQYSPAINLKGNGWGTTAGTSQTIAWRQYVIPIQGATASGSLTYDVSLNGGAYATKFQVASSGTTTVGGGTGSVNAGLYTGNVSSIATTSTDGLVTSNSTASTSGVPVQYSGRIRLHSTVWNTTATAASNNVDWGIEERPVSSTAPTSTLYFMASEVASGNPSFTDVANLSSSGNLNIAGAAQIGTTNSNIYSQGNNGALTQSVAQAQYDGSTTNFVRVMIYGSSNTALTTGASYSQMILGGAPITSFSSGTNKDFTALVIKPPVITSGGATITNAQSGMSFPATGASNNFNWWFNGGVTRMSGAQLDTLTASKVVFTDANKRVTSTGIGTSSQLIAGDGSLVKNKSNGHGIFTPTTGGTVNLVNNQMNIINPSGALVSLTVNLPSSPSNDDQVQIKYTQNITTVTYGNGTVVDGITAPTAGGLVVLTYDSGTTSWY